MLVCERIIRNALNGRASLIELLEEVVAPGFPIRLVAVSVYGRLSDAVGLYSLTVDVVRRDDFAQIFTVNLGRLEATDPLEDAEIVVHDVALELPSPGFYDCRPWMTRRFVHSVSFQARAT